LQKLQRYADVQARIWQAEGRQAKWSSLLFRLPLRFVQGYILRLGFLDGLAGLQVCLLVAYLSWLKQACLWQLQAGRDWREADRQKFPVPKTDATQNEPAPGLAGGSSEVEKLRGVQTPGKAGGYGAVPTESEARTKLRLASRPRTFREFRRRITPKWLSVDARRHRRNIIFRRLGIQRCYTPPIVTREPNLTVRSSLPFVVSHELLRNPRLTFLQIGAYDGIGEDDLRGLVFAHKLRGLLVEPQPNAFARLQHTYRNQPQVTLLQAAVAEAEGTRNLYCRRGEPSMAASFNIEHLRKHGISDDDIETLTVPCHTVESALRTAGLTHVDLIQIDAEGYDWPIIRSIDFAKLQPRILRFEYRHMTDREADDCLALLASHGYRFIMEARDIIAHHSAELTATLAPPQRRIA
jgi:FkbM family methyltransferase